MNGENLGILESLLIRFSNKQSLFVNHILSNDMDSAKKVALELFKSHPQYLLLYCYLDMKESKELLFRALKNIKNIDLNFIYLLLRDNRILYDDIDDIVNKIDGDLFVNKAIKKAQFLKKYKFLSNDDSKEIVFDDVINVLENGNEEKTKLKYLNELRIKKIEIKDKNLKDSIKEELNALLNIIDDFELYKFAIAHEIDIQENASKNLLWYKIIKLKDNLSAIQIIRESLDFLDIYKILCISDIKSVDAENYDILIDFLGKGYKRELLDKMFILYNQNQSFINTKILLALLIASKQENLLVVAFYISSVNKFEDNYEIDLIHLFINRYFCFHSNIQCLMKNLDIKNIQLINTAYIWSDPMIVSKTFFNSPRKVLINAISGDLKSMEASLKSYLTYNRVAYSYSLVKLIRNLKNCAVLSEIEEMKILSTERETMFSLLLGPECRYLFDKITINSKRISSGSIETILSKPLTKFSDDLFKNDYVEFNSDFISTFKRLIK